MDNKKTTETNDQKMLDRLKKMYQLSVRGKDGEKHNAKRLMDQLMAKYGYTIEDIHDDIREDCYFRFSCKQSEKILAQILWKVTSDDRGVYTTNGRKGLVVSVAKHEKIEIEELYEWHWRQYKLERRKVLKDLQMAYLSKHNLFSQRDRGDDEEKSEPMSYEEEMRLRSMMKNMSNETMTKKLEEG